MPHYNAEFSVLGSTTGGHQFYAHKQSEGHSTFTVSRTYYTKCDCGGTYQLVALSHFGYLRHKYLKTYK